MISIPIIHSLADMGSAAGLLEEEYRRRFGELRWTEHRRLVTDFWEAVRRQVLALDLPFSRVRLYQDGLPVCGRELDLVRDVARSGSENYRLLLELVEAGARLEGTEDPELLLQERDQLIQLAGVRDPAARELLMRELESFAQRLLQARDRAVARRIDETLQEDERGLLFMGLKHQVEAHLPPDIAVSYLVGGVKA